MLKSITCAAVVVVSAASTALAGGNPTWGGSYIGGSLGARWADQNWHTNYVGIESHGHTEPTTVDLDNSAASFRGALHAGYNWQSANWVYGIEGDIGFGRNSRNVEYLPGAVFTTAATVDSFKTSLGTDGSLRLRAGMLVTPSTLLYGTGGVAFQQERISATCLAAGPWCVADRTDSSSRTRVGYTLGAGLETLINSNWIGRIEYRFSDFGSKAYTLFPVNSDDEIVGRSRLRTHMLNVGLSYKF